jgi:glycosyltransferase involved in cell wall biosynthesis
MKKGPLFVIDARFISSYPNGLAEFSLELTPAIIKQLSFGDPELRSLVVLSTASANNQPIKIQSFWNDLRSKGVRVVNAPKPLSASAVFWEFWFCSSNQVQTWVSFHYNVPLTYRGRSVSIIHDMMPLALTGYLKGRYAAIKRIIFKMYIAAVIFRPRNLTFSPSNFTRCEIERFFDRPPSRWCLLEPGVSDSLHHACAIWCPPPGKIVLFFIGERRPHKNLHRLIRLSKAINELICCELIIAGKPDNYFFNLDEHLSDNIRYVGPVDDHSKFSLMCEVSYVALISSYEGYGMPVSEANALGVPVLTSKL